MTTEHPFRPRSFFRSPVGLVLLGFLAIAAFFLLTELMSVSTVIVAVNAMLLRRLRLDA